MMKRLFRRRQTEAAPATVPAGQRLYAIGDVHGRFDLLQRLLALIEDDDRRRPRAETTIIFLGDLVDRGLESAAVIESLSRAPPVWASTRFLTGNHEEVLLEALTGNDRAVRAYCRMGGRETLLSYGVTAEQYERMDYATVGTTLKQVVPESHVTFLNSFEDSIVIGDYMFVHAGVDPAAPLEAQRVSSLRWMRNPFLDHPDRLDKLIVHGHTIMPTVDWRQHRIGIDTGAYQTGCLTALGCEGSRTWLVDTGQSKE